MTPPTQCFTRTSLVRLGGGDSHQSFAPRHSYDNLAGLVDALPPAPNRPKIRDDSRGDAGSIGPRALPVSIAMIDSHPDQPHALSGHTQQVQPATAAS